MRKEQRCTLVYPLKKRQTTWGFMCLGYNINKAWYTRRGLLDWYGSFILFLFIWHVIGGNHSWVRAKSFNFQDCARYIHAINQLVDAFRNGFRDSTNHTSSTSPSSPWLVPLISLSLYIVLIQNSPLSLSSLSWWSKDENVVKQSTKKWY